MRRNDNRRWLFGLLLPAMLFVALAVLAGCDSSGTGGVRLVGPESADAAAAMGGPGEEVEIIIAKFRFNPGEIRVKQGTRIVFVNEDPVEHNIIQSGTHRIGAGPASFESPVLAGGQRWGKVFNEPGEYPIICTVDGHQLMGMVGTIVVVPD